MRIKLVARFDLGVTTAVVEEAVVLEEEALPIVAGGAERIDLLSSFGLALRENRVPLGVTAETERESPPKRYRQRDTKICTKGKSRKESHTEPGAWNGT